MAVVGADFFVTGDQMVLGWQQMHSATGALRIASLLLQGVETFSLRMDRHCANAFAVAKFLEAHPSVA